MLPRGEVKASVHTLWHTWEVEVGLVERNMEQVSLQRQTFWDSTWSSRVKRKQHNTWRGSTQMGWVCQNFRATGNFDEFVGGNLLQMQNTGIEVFYNQQMIMWYPGLMTLYQSRRTAASQFPTNWRKPVASLAKVFWERSDEGPLLSWSRASGYSIGRWSVLDMI